MRYTSRVAQSVQNSRGGRLGMLASLAIIVTALYFAKTVLIPIALAVMLSFLLAPLLIRLQRRGLGRIPALLIVLFLLASAMVGLGYVLYTQVYDLANNLPAYRQNIQEKVTWLRGFTRGGPIEKTIKAFNDATSRPATAPASQPVRASPIPGGGAAQTAPPPPPVPVYITNPTQTETRTENEFKVLYASFTPFLAPLATAGIVVIFVIFMLLTREDLRDRIIRLIGQGRINLTTQAMDEAGQRISRYLIAQCIVNGSYGLLIAIGLWIIGLTAGHNHPSFPNWFLWGVLTGILRFIPYIGPWIGAAFPIIISLAVYSGMTVPICVVAMFALVELLSNNLMEPWLYGSSTGVSTVAILVAAVFWTWLWGIPGLLLSTPLTVLIAVTGKYVPQLEFLNILLGDEPALEPKFRFYQRLLADDVEEAEDLLAEFLQKDSVIKVYDEVIIPTLSLAETDARRGRLDGARQAGIRSAVRDMVEEIGEKPRQPADQADASLVKAAYGRGIMCLPARDPADEIAAIMLAQMLEHEGYRAQCVSVDKLAGEYVQMVAQSQAQVVMISALPPSAATHARYLVKRLRAHCADLKIIVCLWIAASGLERPRKRLESAGADLVVANLQSAREQIRQVVAPLQVTEDAKPTEAGHVDDTPSAP